MSSDLMTTYEKKVAAILDETGHPLRRDVMDELRNHLRETFSREDRPQCMEELVDRLGSPEEYAENLAPAVGHRMKPLRRRLSFWIGVAAIATVILLTVVITVNRHSLAAHYRQALGKNFLSAPFFDLDRMRGLKVGASADEIRNAIGYPLIRKERMNKNEVIWEYTSYPSRQAPFYTDARLITDADQMNLIRVEILEHTGIGYHPEDRVLAYPTSVDAGAISFSRPGRQSLVLRPASEYVYVILASMGIETADDLSDAAVERRISFVTTSWKDVPREKVRFIYVVGPKGDMNWPRLEGLLQGLPPDSPIYSGMGMPHVFENRWAPVESLVYDVMVYKSGILYQYPPIYGGPPRIMQEYREDRNWLMHRLLNER